MVVGGSPLRLGASARLPSSIFPNGPRSPWQIKTSRWSLFSTVKSITTLNFELSSKTQASSSTTSDTEVLLHLYQRLGDKMVLKLRGMFAFAIWDNEKSGIFLARDPYGIKPLYVANDGWTFQFASQVKALLAGGGVSRDPEPAGIVGFHLLGSVPEPFTLYREILALPAGHTQWVDRKGPRDAEAYYSIAAVLAEGARQRFNPQTIATRVREAALDSVRAHLLADVEIGIFLSAGVDSGALLGLIRDATGGGVKAITLAFPQFAGTDNDEAVLAAEVAQGTERNTLYGR